MTGKTTGRTALVGVLGVIDGEPHGALFALFEGENRIGVREGQLSGVTPVGDASCLIRVVFEAGAVALIAEDGPVPVYVNREPVEICELADGDVVRLGETTLRYRTLPGLGMAL